MSLKKLILIGCLFSSFSANGSTHFFRKLIALGIGGALAYNINQKHAQDIVKELYRIVLSKSAPSKRNDKDYNWGVKYPAYLLRCTSALVIFGVVNSLLDHE